MANMTCPRCGYVKCKPNSRTTVHCRKCGGTVPLKAEPEPEYYGSDPLQNLLDKERGVNESGRVLPNRNQQLKGGL